MCRSGNEPLTTGTTATKRRCPCSAGDTRRQADRIRYRLDRIAANLTTHPTTDPPTPTQTSPTPPTIEEVKEQMQRTEQAWQQYQNAPMTVFEVGQEQANHDTDQARADYEAAVRQTGQMIHDRAARLHTIPEAIDFQQHYQEAIAADQAEYDRCLAIQVGYSQRSQEIGGVSKVSTEFRAEWDAASTATSEVSERLRNHTRTMQSDADQRQQQRAEGYRAVLAEVQELGGELGMHQGGTTTTHTTVRAVAQSVADTTPTAWIDKSNAAHQAVPLYVYPSKGRAHYQSRAEVPIGDSKTVMSGAFINDDPDNPPDWEPLKKSEKWVRDDNWGIGYYGSGMSHRGVAWRKQGRATKTKVTAARLTVPAHSGETDQARVARHEFAHRIESLNPRVATAAKEFRTRRTTKSDGTSEPLSRIYDEGQTEVGWRDGFVDHYVGKDYGHGPHTEVFSVGSEAVWDGSHGGLVGDGPNAVADTEHRNLILGLYACAK